jgi:hypothetical protein
VSHKAGGEIVVDFRQQVGGLEGAFQTVTTLSVGRWGNAFNNVDTNPTLKQNPKGYANGMLFINLDPSHFKVRVIDPMKNGAGPLQVDVQTSSDTGHNITLTETGGKNTGVFESQWLLLTTFSVDKAAGGNEALKVNLGDTVRAIYGEKATATASVPVLKVVKLHISILRKTQGGQAVASITKVMADVGRANLIYAQAGILLVASADTVNPPAKLGNLSAGLPTHFTAGKDTGSRIGLTKQEIALLSDKNLWPPTNVNGTKQAISVYYINYFEDAMGREIPNGYGESFPAKLVTNIQYADSIIVSANNEQYQTLAHEIGHILENNGEHSNSKVNLMYGGVPPLVKNTPPTTDSRRISATQAARMRNNRPNLLS